MDTQSPPEKDVSNSDAEYGALRPASFFLLGAVPIALFGGTRTTPFLASYGWLAISAVCSLALTFAYFWWLFAPYFQNERRRTRLIANTMGTLLFSPFLFLIFKQCGASFVTEEATRQAWILNVELQRNSGKRLSQCLNFVTIEFTEPKSTETFCADGIAKRMLDKGTVQVRTIEGWVGIKIIEVRT